MSDTHPSADAVSACVHAVQNVLSPGDLAALRRLTPDQPFNPALYRVLATVVEPLDVLPEREPHRTDRERRWGALLQAFAQQPALVTSAPKASLGRSLGAAGLSELRLERLLRATDSLADEVRATVAFLASKAQSIPARDLADLLLSTDPDHIERCRRRIARDYFRELHNQTKKDS